jgi:arabinogalactan endo-1,4-beta-galactosidase
MYKRLLSAAILLVFILATACSKKDTIKAAPSIETLEIKGADVSYLTELRQSGIVLRNAQNQTEDVLVTLKKSGVNVIRLRLWNNPSTSTSNFPTVKNLSKEVKGLGMKVMLTVHYSDTWADPSKQVKPAAWQSLSFTHLQDSVYQFTKKIITEIDPEYIQIGNEINNGFLFPEGRISNLSQMKQLLQKGIAAVRDVNPKTKIILHYAGHEYANAFYTKFSDLDYDIIGVSYYPMWHGKSLSTLKQNLITISSSQNKPIFIAETSYPFTFGWNDWTNNIIGDQNQILSEYNASPAGQKEYLLKIKEIISETPKGIGFCYWGAEWISYKGNESKEGSSWENQAFWDFENKALPVLEAYK